MSDKTIFSTLTFKPFALAYANACKKHNTPRDAFYILTQHGNLLHFSDVLYNLFHSLQNAIYFKILYFSVQIIYTYILSPLPP